MSKKISRNKLWLFIILIGLESIAANLAHPITPTIIKNMHLPNYMFGVAYSVMAFSNFLFSPFWAKMVDYKGSKNVLAITMCGYAFGQLLFMMSSNSLFLVLARSISGIFAGGIYVSFLTYIVNHSEKEVQAQFLTMNATMQTIAGSIGFLVGGLLGEVSLQLTFIAQVVMLVSIGGLFFLTCENDEVVTPPSNWRKEINPFKAFKDAKNIVTPLLFMLFIVVLLSSSATTTFDQNFNYYLKDVLGLTSKYNGTIKGIVGVISLITNMTICMWIIKTNRSYKSLILLFFLAFVSLVTMASQAKIIPFLIGALIYYGINAIYLPLVQGVVADNANEGEKNAVMGLYNSMKSMGMVLGGLLAGFLYSIKPNVPFIVSSILFLICGIILLANLKRKKEG